MPKHSSDCEIRTTHVKSFPAATMSGADENDTDSGVDDSANVFASLPNCPEELSPKHHALVPATVQECANPAAADDDAPPPNAERRVGVNESDTDDAPRRPLLYAPQHHVSPVVLVAHACREPRSSEDTTNDDGTDVTAVGVA